MMEGGGESSHLDRGGQAASPAGETTVVFVCVRVGASPKRKKKPEKVVRF